MSAAAASWSAGLSPRVRGNQQGCVPLNGLEGSIPACAGEPAISPPTCGLTSVYPRVCGGTPSSTAPRRSPTGLSPRVRGNPLPARRGCVTERSIPACAGEPHNNKPPPSQGQVYPRVCGGTPCKNRQWFPACGLSPRVRGNPKAGPKAVRTTGSIPACAGEPLHDDVTDELTTVYPRVCGGTRKQARKQFERQGLSPRVRGNPCTTT